MLEVGLAVRVLAPFDAAFPGVYVISSQNADTGSWRIWVEDFSEEREFDAKFLEPI